MCSGGSCTDGEIVRIQGEQLSLMQRELEYQARKEADRRRKDSRTSTISGRRDQQKWLAPGCRVVSRAELKHHL